MNKGMSIYVKFNLENLKEYVRFVPNIEKKILR